MQPADARFISLHADCAPWSEQKSSDIDHVCERTPLRRDSAYRRASCKVLSQERKDFFMGALSYQKVDVDGISIFYREAGSKDAPTILLLHGFPTAGHMFRD